MIHGAYLDLPRAATVRRFTASGVYIPPAEVAFVEVELIGGGASGHPAQAPGANTGRIGAGGPAGGYIRAIIAANLLPSSVPITIGAGGVPFAASSGAGGASSFGALVTAEGGGLAGQLVNGTFNLTGAVSRGGILYSNVSNQGGDSSAAAGVQIVEAQKGWAAIRGWIFLNSAGTQAYLVGGQGADSPFGRGGASLAAFAAPAFNISNPGAPATGFGAGGGGGVAVGTAAAIGGAGSPGLVTITEFY